MEVSAKTKEHPEEVTVNVDIPEGLQDLVAKYGEEVVASNAKGAIIIGLQSYIRRHIDKTQNEIQELAAAWVPGTRSPAVHKTALEKATSAVAQMSPEERAALLAKLQAAG